MQIPTATLAATLLLALAGQRALAGTPQTVAIAVDTNSLGAKIAAEVQDGIVPRILSGLTEVMSSLAATDITLTLVRESRTLEQVLECEGIECLQDLAESAKVDLVIQVRVQAKQVSKQASPKASKRSRQDFHLSMVVARSTPERDAWIEKTDCQACEASEIKHTASLLSSLIAERVKVKPTPSEPPHEAGPTPMHLAPPAPSPASPVTPLPAPVPSKWSVPTYLSVTALAGGLLLIGSGLYLIHINGQGTCDLTAPQYVCPRKYQTQNWGIGLFAGGQLAALGGLAGLFFFSPSVGTTHMALNVTGSSIAVSGAF